MNNYLSGHITVVVYSNRYIQHNHTISCLNQLCCKLGNLADLTCIWVFHWTTGKQLLSNNGNNNTDKKINPAYNKWNITTKPGVNWLHLKESCKIVCVFKCNKFIFMFKLKSEQSNGSDVQIWPIKWNWWANLTNQMALMCKSDYSSKTDMPIWKFYNLRLRCYLTQWQRRTLLCPRYQVYNTDQYSGSCINGTHVYS